MYYATQEEGLKASFFKQKWHCDLPKNDKEDRIV